MKRSILLLCTGILSFHFFTHANQSDETEAERILSASSVFEILNKSESDFDKNKDLKAQLKTAIKNLIKKYHPDRTVLASKDKQKKITQKLNEFLDDPFKALPRENTSNLSNISLLSEKLPYWSNRIQAAGENADAWSNVLDDIIKHPDVQKSKTKRNFIVLKVLASEVCQAYVTVRNALKTKKISLARDTVLELFEKEKGIKKEMTSSGFGQKIKGFFSSKSKKDNETILNNLVDVILDVLKRKISSLEASVPGLKISNATGIDL